MFVAVLAAVTAAIAACSSSGTTDPTAALPSSGTVSTSPSTANPSPIASRAPEAAAALGPDGRAVPRPDRPVVQLHFDLTGWRTGAVTGSEDVKFTPDLKVCELVFRLWPNKPKTADDGDLLTVTKATVQGAEVKPELQGASGKDGALTLLQLPLSSCAAPGTVLNAHLEFGLKIGVDVPERVGRASDGSYAWLGTGYPLLAWEHGAGWMRDPAVDVYGELAGSEDYNLRSLDVVAPKGDQVLGAGQLVPVKRPYDGAAHYRSSAPAVRDVLITVGRFTELQSAVGDVTVHLATHLGTQVSRWAWLAAARKSLAGLSQLLGPFPYRDVWLTVTDTQLDGGIGYPGAAILGDVESADVPKVITQALAQSYFSGLVGTDQGRDPWLDAAFMTWAEVVVDHAPAPTPPPDAPDGKVGRPMAYWAEQPDVDRTFVESVYGWGSLALTTARREVGARAFDGAVRHYLEVNAHRIARPEDLAAAFAKLPAVLTTLRNAGALPS